MKWTEHLYRWKEYGTTVPSSYAPTDIGWNYLHYPASITPLGLMHDYVQGTDTCSGRREQQEAATITIIDRSATRIPQPGLLHWYQLPVTEEDMCVL